MTKQELASGHKQARYNIVENIIISDIRDYSNDKFTEYLVNIQDISENGIGFISAINLEKGCIYSSKITLYGKHTISPYICIQRKEQLDNNTYFYGAIFKGMSKKEKVYFRTFSVLNRNNKVDIY